MTATAVTTSNLQIHGVNIDVFSENHPGGGTACGIFTGETFRLTGTLTGAKWLGSSSIELAGATGLVSHYPPIFGGTSTLTPTGTITDPQETLTVN